MLSFLPPIIMAAKDITFESLHGRSYNGVKGVSLIFSSLIFSSFSNLYLSSIDI